jgi:hypothetical protein
MLLITKGYKFSYFGIRTAYTHTELSPRLSLSRKQEEIFMLLRSLLVSCLFAATAFASTLQIAAPALVPGSTNSSTVYTLKTNGNGGINGGQTGFSSASNNLTATTGFSGYLSGLPGGATITGATLNLQALFGQSPFSQVGSNVFFTPGFASTISNFNIGISSTLHSVSFAGNSLSGYDLFANGFAADILAGDALSLVFTAKDGFTANTSGYVASSSNKNKTETFTLTAPITISGANELDISYNQQSVSAVPEPSSALLMLSGGLSLFGVIGRKLTA